MKQTIYTRNKPMILVGMFSLILGLVSCITLPEPLPMPQGADMIKKVLSVQETSIDLYNKCKPAGLVETMVVGFYDPYIVERRAIELKANTFQILYKKGAQRSVRFWKCPEQKKQ